MICMVIETVAGTGTITEVINQTREITPAQGAEREEILRFQRAMFESHRIFDGHDYYQFVGNMFRLFGGIQSPTKDISNPMPEEEDVTLRFVLDHSDGSVSLWSRGATIVESKSIGAGLTDVMRHEWARNLISPEGKKFLHVDNPHVLDSTVMEEYDSPNFLNGRDFYLGSEFMIPLNTTRMCEKILNQVEGIVQPQTVTV